MISALRKRFVLWVECERGSVFALLSVMAFLLILAVGVAVDMARAQILQQRMSSALDAAGLAALETINTPDPAFEGDNAGWATEEANRFFAANFPAGYLGSGALPVVSAVPTADLNTINLSVATPQGTVFMQTFGVNAMNVGATSQVTRNPNGVGAEIVLVLDNTGSMNAVALGGQTKIQALKTAATDFLNIIYGGNDTLPNLWVGVVPFSQTVNVGIPDWIVNYSPDLVSGAWDNAYNASLPYGPYNDAWGVAAWTGGVESRSPTLTDPSNGLTYDISDLPPSASDPASLFRYYFFPPNDPANSPVCDVSELCYYNQWRTGTSPTYSYSFINSTDPLQTEGSVLPLIPPILDNWYWPSWGILGPNIYTPPIVTLLTASKTILLNGVGPGDPVGGIADLLGVGDTEIDLGLAWGWRLLSPKWRGIWNSYFTADMATNNLPLDYNTPGMHKIVILMTDGTNYITQGTYTAYGFMHDLTLGNGYGNPASGCQVTQPCWDWNTVLQAAALDLDARTLAVCTAMKTQGIIIFTIGFGTPAPDDPPNLIDRQNPLYVDVPLLTACASQPSYFFLAPTQEQLRGAFQAIGNTINGIRISK